MAVRNFWISADIDGRETMLEGGPRSKDGGFTLYIYQRHEGSIVRAAYIAGFVHLDGSIELAVSPQGKDTQSEKRPEGVTVKPIDDGGFLIESKR